VRGAAEVCENNRTSYFWSSGFYTIKKLVIRAICDKQHIHACHSRLANNGQKTTLRLLGGMLFDARVRRFPWT